MCMICAAIPAAAAVGAKLNADQIHKAESRRLPVARITALVMGTLMLVSTVYHTLQWESS
jgi:hypothetical protein